MTFSKGGVTCMLLENLSCRASLAIMADCLKAVLIMPGSILPVSLMKLCRYHPPPGAAAWSWQPAFTCHSVGIGAHVGCNGIQVIVPEVGGAF